MGKLEQRLIVFVDTSYLRKKAKTQSADWNRLLILAKRREIEIHISEIAINEYRSQCVDHLHAKIEKSRDALRRLENEWSTNPVTANLDDMADFDIFPDLKQLESEAAKMIDALVKDHHIVVISSTEDHGKRVWC